MPASAPARLRKPGAGRKRRTEADPQLPDSLDKLVDPLSRSEPDSPLRWTGKSTVQPYPRFVSFSGLCGMAMA